MDKFVPKVGLSLALWAFGLFCLWFYSRGAGGEEFFNQDFRMKFPEFAIAMGLATLWLMLASKPSQSTISKPQRPEPGGGYRSERPTASGQDGLDVNGAGGDAD